MKNIFISIFVLSLFIAIFGCKSKQQTVALSGAHVEAGRTLTPVAREVTPVYNSSNKSSEAPPYGGNLASPSKQTSTVFPSASVSEPEEVRDEKFRLDTEERNMDAIKMKYHVVVGSFKNRDNAKRLQATLKSEGNNAIIVVNEQGMYRVLIASYNEYLQARERISRINNRFADAWVLVQKED